MKVIFSTEKKRKGSVDYDFILSIGLFAIAYVSLFTLLPYINSTSITTQDNLIQEANYLSSILIKTPGYPKNWTSTSDVYSLGFCYYDNTSYYPNIIDLNKVKALTSVSCSSLQEKTEVKTSFAINLKLNNGTSYNCTGSVPDKARLIERKVMVNANKIYMPGKIELYMW